MNYATKQTHSRTALDNDNNADQNNHKILNGTQSNYLLKQSKPSYITIPVENIIDHLEHYEQIQQMINKQTAKYEIYAETSKYIMNAVPLRKMFGEKEIFWYNADGRWYANGNEVINDFAIKVNFLFTRYAIEEILSKVKNSINKCYPDDFNRKLVVCLKNGVFDLTDYQLKEFSPDYMLNKSLPIEYNPNTDCPIINTFLETNIPDKKERRTFLEAVGFCLEPGYRYHHFFLIYGPTRTGKDTALNLLMKFLGGVKNISNLEPHQIIKEKYAKAELWDKYANISSDISATRILDTSMIKKLTGESAISSDLKYAKYRRNFTNAAKMWWSANKYPEVPNDDAFLQRCITINFPTQHFENADDQLLAKMTTSEELSGFLNLVLKAYKRLKERGGFDVSFDQKQSETSYNIRADSIKYFYQEYCELEWDAWISKEEIYSAYKQLCHEQKVAHESITSFTKRLKELSQGAITTKRQMRKGKRAKGYQGVRLL